MSVYRICQFIDFHNSSCNDIHIHCCLYFMYLYIDLYNKKGFHVYFIIMMYMVHIKEQLKSVKYDMYI